MSDQVAPTNVKVVFTGKSPAKTKGNTKARKMKARGLISEKQMRRFGARS